MKIHAAAVQMSSTLDKEKNVATASSLVERAAEQGAQFVVLPEFFNCLGELAEVAAQAEPVPGPTSEQMGRLAARLNITLLAGSLCERSEEDDATYNTQLLFDPAGRCLTKYRKMHLFDCCVPGKISVTESNWISAGRDAVTIDTPVGCLGLATCYDLRFPELFRQLSRQGMQTLGFASAFMAATGEAHWEVLLRARAIENQVYVVAANQYGFHAPGMITYGHSLIADPWGRVLATAAEGDAVVSATLDYEQLAEIRCNLPALAHRRLF